MNIEDRSPNSAPILSCATGQLIQMEECTLPNRLSPGNENRLRYPPV